MALTSSALYKLKRRIVDNEPLRNLNRKLRRDKYSKETLNSQGSREIDALLSEVMSALKSKPEDFPMFQMVVKEFCDNVRPLVAKNANFVKAVRKLCEPETILAFDIVWKNQHGEQMLNRGWRCNYCSVLGACRGGVRMHPTVNQDMIVALAFQVTLQNALSNLPMGGCFMGTDFDARNYCDADVQSFCFEFVFQICKDLPPHWPFDITCDLGCGPRECAMLDKAHRRYAILMRNSRSRGSGSSVRQLVGNLYSSEDGGSESYRGDTALIAPRIIGRPYSVGIGAVEFGKLFCKLPSFDKTVCIISGAGDCALTVAKCLIEEGAVVTTLSDTSGFVYCPLGISYLQWQRINQHRVHRVPLRDILTQDGWVNSETRPSAKPITSRKGCQMISEGIKWYPGNLWQYGLKADYVFPCSHELELDIQEAEILVSDTKAKAVLEISYLSCTDDAQYYLLMHKVRIAPSKLCNMAPMISLGMHLAEKMEKAHFEHEIKSYMTYVYNYVKSIYTSYYPDVFFKEAADCAALLTLTKEMISHGQLS